MGRWKGWVGFFFRGHLGVEKKKSGAPPTPGDGRRNFDTSWGGEVEREKGGSGSTFLGVTLEGGLSTLGLSFWAEGLAVLCYLIRMRAMVARISIPFRISVNPPPGMCQRKPRPSHAPRRSSEEVYMNAWGRFLTNLCKTSQDAEKI